VGEIFILKSSPLVEAGTFREGNLVAERVEEWLRGRALQPASQASIVLLGGSAAIRGSDGQAQDD
jgi:hypothetical protein